MVASYNEHQREILDARLQQGAGQYLVSGDIQGDVRIWDIRQSIPIKQLTAIPDGDMFAFAVHERAPVFAW